MKVGPTKIVKKEVIRTFRAMLKSIVVVEAIHHKLQQDFFTKVDPNNIAGADKETFMVWLEIAVGVEVDNLVDAGGHLNEVLSQPTYLMTRNSTPKSERISGVVIDARNIYHIPAMVPKIFNEEDKLVYGPRHYTRSRSINRGPMGYAHSLDDGNVKRRVGGNPIVIEALGSEDNTNLTISNSDSERIRDAEKRFGLLTNCKVLVLLK